MGRGLPRVGQGVRLGNPWGRPTDLDYAGAEVNYPRGTMQHPVGTDVLPEATRRALAGAGPLRMMVARGVAPLPPVALVSALYALAYDSDDGLKTAARTTLERLPEPVLNGALSANDLHPAVLDELAERLKIRQEVLQRILRHPAVADETVARVARRCDESTAEVVATNEQRLLRHPAIIESLYFNQNTRMSTADRVVELAARNGLTVSIPNFEHIVAALQQQLVPEPSVEALPSDEAFTEALVSSAAVDDILAAVDDEDEDFIVPAAGEKVEKSLEEMSVTEQIRTAMIGTSSQRALLIRSSNRIIAAAVLDSPKLGDNEVMRFAASRSISEDILRKIASRRQLVRLYDVKLNLVMNPKTPVADSMRLLNYLRESDVKKLPSSKAIPAAIRMAATGLLNKRKKKE